MTDCVASLKYKIIKTLQYLEVHCHQLPKPMGELLVREYGKDPFILLIACLLSLRARDRIVYPICQKLFARIRTPQELIDFPRAELEQLLRPIGFYRAKAATLQKVASFVQNDLDGKISGVEEDLLLIPGVGRKTANFMLSYVFDIPALCVDTHVHRLANLFGWIATRTVFETEQCLARLVSTSSWSRLNTLLVTWGQNVCKPAMSRVAYQEHLQRCPCAKEFGLE